jgi:hypothetical protein
MKLSENGRWGLTLILLLLAGSVGCQPSTTAPTAADATGPAADLMPRSVTIEEEIEFGPGSLDLPDMRVGLAEASSYRSSLTITFDGTQAGQPLKWSGAYTHAASAEPSGRQLMIETSGDGSEPPVLMLELNGVAYEESGEEGCVADLIDPDNSALGELEPAAQLPSLFGAEEAGTETVNGVQGVHYTFDERALTEAGLSKSTGELWLASEGGYVLRYRQTTTADEDYFGEGTQGTMSWDYVLTGINQPVTIELPADCPLGLVDAPMMPDAANVESLPALLDYETASSVQDVAAFYMQELPELGWTAPSSGEFELPEGISAEEYQQALEYMQGMGFGQPTPTPDPNESYLIFEQSGRQLSVSLTRAGPVTQVFITLRNVTQ